MKTLEATVSFETRSAKGVPFVGQRKRMRLNGHVENFRVRSVSVTEKWLYRQSGEGQYPVYSGEIVYERDIE